MKIAITSTGNGLKSKLDPRFGRCSYFAIYDTETKETEFFKNPNKEAMEGAGPATVQFIAEKGIKKIIGAEFGIKAKPLLDSLKIQIIVYKEPDKNIEEIIAMLNQ
ncbi:MAG: NifB/NifX family molybdenum-iron cluster-binding protein [Bacteroidales bacterium]|nr:NifB/NifX family molybdenum-iron cluster-binding protein [Bacteroidales bacterium]